MFVFIQVYRTYWQTLVEWRLDLLQRVANMQRFFLRGLGILLCFVELFLDGLQIGKREFSVDDFDIIKRAYRTRHVRYIVIFKTAHDVHDRMTFADVRQKLVTKSLSLGRAGYKPGNVDKLHRRSNDLQRFDDRRNDAKTRIRHRHYPDVRLNRAKRVILGRDSGRCQGIEQGRLANVGQTDDATLDCHLVFLCM